MKRFRIHIGADVIGETDLEMHDPEMNVYSGRFYTTIKYNNVRAVFKIFSRALDLTGNQQRTELEEYYRQRDNLKLEIEYLDCKRLDANWIHIIDLDDLDDVRVEVALRELLAPRS